MRDRREGGEQRERVGEHEGWHELGQRLCTRGRTSHKERSPGASSRRRRRTRGSSLPASSHSPSHSRSSSRSENARDSRGSSSDRSSSSSCGSPRGDLGLETLAFREWPLDTLRPVLEAAETKDATDAMLCARLTDLARLGPGSSSSGSASGVTAGARGRPIPRKVAVRGVGGGDGGMEGDGEDERVTRDNLVEFNASCPNFRPSAVCPRAQPPTSHLAPTHVAEHVQAQRAHRVL